MVRRPCSSCPHLTPFVARLASGLRCFPSVDRVAAPSSSEDASGTANPSSRETLAAPKDAVALRPSGPVSNATGKPVVSSGSAKNGLPVALCPSFRSASPLLEPVWLVAGVGFARPRFQDESAWGAVSPAVGKCVRSTPATHRLIFSKTTARVSLHSEPLTSPTGFGGFPVLRWETRFGGSRSRLRGVFDLSAGHSTEPLTLRRRTCVPSPSASREARFGTSSQDWSRLVPVRVRVVVPYFPSPESLSPSFGALHPGDLSAFAAMRLSSSGPEGPSDSVRQAPLVSFCSARDPRATPWPLSPRALMELGRHKSSLQRSGASPRGRSSRPTPRPSRSCGLSSSS